MACDELPGRPGRATVSASPRAVHGPAPGVRPSGELCRAETGQQIRYVDAAAVEATSEHELIRRRTGPLRVARTDGLE